MAFGKTATDPTIGVNSTGLNTGKFRLCIRSFEKQFPLVILVLGVFLEKLPKIKFPPK